jgi:hypothetical protein
MTDTLATGAAAAPAPSPASAPPASAPASTSPPAAAPRPSAAPNPRSVGFSPKRNQMEEAAARAAGEAPPPPAGDQQQPPAAQGAKIRLGEDLELTESEIRDALTFKALEDSKRLSRPQKADDYKIALPKDFKAPVGIEFRLDDKDPAFGQLKDAALRHGASQQFVEELIGIYAGREVGTQASIDAARAAEVAKLGTSGPARIDNVTRWMDASGLGVLKSSLVTAAQVEAVEKWMSAAETQGVGRFSQSHRAAPDEQRIPGYENMSFEQRRFAQDQMNARRNSR